MEKIELNIPTIYSHSLFLDGSNKNINITKRGIDYYYSLIYIYRLRILEDTSNLLIKEKDENNKIKHHWNDDIKDWNSLPIDIDMYEVLSTINETHNSDYESLREFIHQLNLLHIKTNILNKDTTKSSQIIRIVDTVSCDKTKINIKFNDEFIKEFIYVNSFYKKVILNHFFNLGGYKSKVLYLVMKDYVGISKKITQKDITSIVGDIFSNSRFIGIIEKINDTTDVTIKEEKKKRGKVTTYNFTIRSHTKFINKKDEIEFNVKRDLWKKSEEMTQANSNKGIKIDNVDEYTKSIYKKLMSDFYNIVEIEEYIDEVRKSMMDKKDTNTYQYIVMVSEKDKKEYIINDDYLVFEYPFPKQNTMDVENTYKMIDEGKIGWKFITTDKALLNYTKSLL
jgi:hypothetical protein